MEKNKKIYQNKMIKSWTEMRINDKPLYDDIRNWFKSQVEKIATMNHQSKSSKYFIVISTEDKQNFIDLMKRYLKDDFVENKISNSLVTLTLRNALSIKMRKFEKNLKTAQDGIDFTKGMIAFQSMYYDKIAKVVEPTITEA